MDEVINDSGRAGTCDEQLIAGARHGYMLQHPRVQTLKAQSTFQD